MRSHVVASGWNLKGSGASLPSAVLSLDEEGGRGKLAGFAEMMRPFKRRGVAALWRHSAGRGQTSRPVDGLSRELGIWEMTGWLTASTSTSLVTGGLCSWQSHHRIILAQERYEALHITNTDHPWNTERLG